MKHNSHIQVVYIITKLELGGAQKVCLELFEGLTKQDITTLLIASNKGLLVEKVQHKSNVILLPELQREVSWRALMQEISCFKTLIKQLKQLKKQYPELIVHTHSTKAGIWGRWAAFFAGVKTRIHTVHGFAFHEHQSSFKWFVIYVTELLTSFITTHFVCVSSQDVKTGIRLFPRFSSKNSIIRAAVNVQKFIPAYKSTLQSRDIFIFGSVACFKPQKNIFDLLRAFEIVHKQNPNTKLEIIGDGVLRHTIEQWIIDHNLQKEIILHGWQDTVASIMSTWNAFTLSSLWEGLPCAVIEARLLQLPVICYNTGGICDVIFHGKNGFLYTQGNVQELAQGMLAVSQNTDLYNSLRSFNDDLRDFSVQQMLKEHLKLYKNI